jgi:ABC-type branched-subunit amino acid transport system substrate-binding protein
MKTRFFFLLTTLVCVSISAAAMGQDLKVGTLFDHTGALKEWGPHHQKAAELAASQLAAAGLKIHFINKDSGTDARKAVTAAEELVKTDKVAAIIGSGSSGVTIPVAEKVTCPGDTLMITPASTAAYISDLPADRKKDFLFRTCPSDALQGVVLGKLAASLYKTASVMYVNNAYGQGLAWQFRKSFQKRGGIVFAMIPHDEGVAKSYIHDLRKAYTPVFSTKPYISGQSDVLCVFSYPEQAKVYVKEAIEQFGARHFLFSDGSKSEKLAKAVGPKYLEGMMGTAPGVAAGESFASFFADYKEAYGSLPTVPFIANAYDAAAVIGLAAYAARVKGLPLTSANIRDQLRAVADPPGKFIGAGDFKEAFALLDQGKPINYEGASGSVDFDDKGDVLAPIEIWKFGKGGAIVPYSIEYQIPED